MESLGGKRKKIEKVARSTLRAAIVATTLMHPEQSLAGRREASRIVEGIKMSDTIKPGIVAEDSPKESNNERPEL